ncbi:hypothetical protein BC830DRAFT_665504 [Chytriomyces sp. MP71]|nr:hypothetical protein BC830DRAFT_665504 [Chytriomyces sp. MP71]
MPGGVPKRKATATKLSEEAAEAAMKSEWHEDFMQKARNCVSVQLRRSASRPNSSRSNAISNSEGSSFGGGPTVSSIAKARPPIMGTSYGTFHDPDEPQRPRKILSAPGGRRGLKASTSPVNIISHASSASNCEQRVIEYFKRLARSHNGSENQNHYTVMSMTPLKENAHLNTHFSVSEYIQNYRNEMAISDRDKNIDPVSRSFSIVNYIGTELEHFLASIRKPCPARSERDIRAIFQHVRRIQTFETLENWRLWELCKGMKYVQVPRGRVIFRQGDLGTAFYFIIAGRVSVSISKTGKQDDNVVVRQMETGEGFGAIALVSNTPRSATVEAVEMTELLKVERDDYFALFQFDHQHEWSEIGAFLQRTSIFGSWNAATVKSIARKGNIKTYNKHDIIYRQDKGEDAYLYFVKAGVVSVVKQVVLKTKQICPVVVGILHSNEYFGEEVILVDRDGSVPRKCTIVAGDLRKFSKAKLVSLLEGTHSLVSRRNGEDKFECEVVRLDTMDLRQAIHGLVTYSKFTLTTNEQLLQLEHSRMERRKWKEFREREMDRLMKEKLVDPTTTFRKLRNAAKQDKMKKWR